MLISFDKTGFPLIVLDDVGLEVHLLPITAGQFAAFCHDQTKHPYEKLLKAHPHIEPHSFNLNKRERHFLRGVLPDEAKAFAAWLGEGYDLPTVKEWRDVYRALRRRPVPHHDLTEQMDLLPNTILSAFLERMRLRSMLDLSLMRGGLVEWVKDMESKRWVGLGAPRSQFKPNLWAPLRDTVKPINRKARLPYFGFRLVRRGEWYLADRERVQYIY